MLKIIVELHPTWGGEKQILSEMKIINTVDCKYRPDFGNYKITIDGKEETKRKMSESHKLRYKKLKEA